MFDDFDLEDVAEVEAIFPGMIFGVVDFSCIDCGHTQTHEANEHGNNLYVCEECGTINEL